MKALTIRQPWAHAIIEGWKPIENRSWPTKIRGMIAIHAAKKIELDEFLYFVWKQKLEVQCALDAALGRSLPCGCIIGLVNVVDCVTSSSSPWFEGPFGFALANPRRLDPIPCRGALQIFDLDPTVSREIELQLTAGT